jgi:DNA-binding CsgD family transcriptional regulator
MGLPFLIFAWLMLIQFAAGMSGRKPGTRKVIVFLAVNFLILFLLGFLVARRNITDPTQLVRYYFIFANILWSLTASYLIHLPGKRRALIHEHDRRITSPLISIIAAAYCVPVVLYDNEPWLLLIFIFLFFAGNTFLPFYFTYGTLVAAAAKQPGENLSYEQFCSKFEVSPRESEIINEICKGLSNKEIADKLFITLQTVKDHTHRIYIKTNVRSRVQLINLVKEEVKD